ncbi:Ammonium/H(+) antiporter subunit AmhM [Micromonospora sp. MW-13]|uniref:potassium transporter TrkA n=1 Tax=unclassified Micromonospora TaxID=2617518 RepID=UPI000E4415D6|nr:MULTISPECIES: potassium transporter TrkA [unclassified Micromonospora]MCX4472610.1 potassium transporter TrkA [Micromonospora sp. NBC_01655]RGC69300.1 Ammonium/H(+) antiporter subunit AmhM [Micromonospora sp. MW-13]
MEVEHTPLPGIGMRHCFTTERGRRVGVVTHHASGRRDLVHDDGSDPDSSCSLTLTRAEAIALAGLLGILDIVDVTDGPDHRIPDPEPQTGPGS